MLYVSFSNFLSLISFPRFYKHPLKYSNTIEIKKLSQSIVILSLSFQLFQTLVSINISFCKNIFFLSNVITFIPLQFISRALSFNHYKTFQYLRAKVYIDTETKRTSAIKVGSISIRSSPALRQLFLNYAVQVHENREVW